MEDNNTTVSSHHDAGTANPLFNLAGQEGAGSGVSPLEQEVLDEYARLLKNMNHVRGH